MQFPIFGREADFQRHVEILADSLDWEFRHISEGAYEAAADARSYIPAGIPDLELRYYQAEHDKPIIMFAELKLDDPRRDLTDKQEDYLNGFAHIIPCFLWRPKDLAWITEVLQYGPPKPTGYIIKERPKLGTEMLVPDEDKRTSIKNVFSSIKIHRDLSDELAELRREDVTSVVDSVIRNIGRANFRSGHLAGLRRMNPDSPGTTAAYWGLMASENLLGNPNLERKWALILHGIALMTPTSGNANSNRTAHSGNVPVGRALYLGGDPNRGERAYYSESRLHRLLTARETILRTLLARMFRMMASANQTFNWHDMAWFILNEGHEERFEMARRSIASAYYQAARHGVQTENE